MDTAEYLPWVPRLIASSLVLTAAALVVIVDFIQGRRGMKIHAGFKGPQHQGPRPKPPVYFVSGVVGGGGFGGAGGSVGAQGSNGSDEWISLAGKLFGGGGAGYSVKRRDPLQNLSQAEVTELAKRWFRGPVRRRS